MVRGKEAEAEKLAKERNVITSMSFTLLVKRFRL